MTTPPSKKSTAPQGQGKGGTAKSRSKPSQGKKKTAVQSFFFGKGRPRKKKRGGGRVLPAFLAGAIIASAVFWLVRDFSMPDFSADRGGSARQEHAQPPSGQTPSTHRQPQLPNSSAQAPASPASSASAPQPDHEESRRDAARSSAVASALKELQALPYEEPLEESLNERVRHMDYALMQAAWLRNLPPDALRLVAVKDHRANGEHYLYQVVEVLPGPELSSSAAFIETLRDCLAKWADGASIREHDGVLWTLSVNGIPTHELRLYPGRDTFPSGAAAQTPPPESPHAPPVMSRPRHPDAEPMLVIVIDDLGAGKNALDTLLSLEYPVSFAFWPHARHTDAGARAAHAKGREVLVHLPMEPLGYPSVNPGPNVLLTSMNAARLRALTEAGIAAVPYATGLNNHMGSRFTQHAPSVVAVLDVLKKRGLFMLDSLTHNRSVFAAEAMRMGVAHHRRNVFLDVEPSRAKVLDALRKAEKIAMLGGQSIAIGHPLPGTLAALKDWQRLRNANVRIVRLCDLPQ